MQPYSGILITGVGCVGKSSLRRRVAEAFGNRVVCVDRDDALPEPEVAPGQVLVVESVHGLEEPPDRWGLVIYLLPRPGLALRWLWRGLIWFRTGKVDRPPRALRKALSLRNIPIIVHLVARNLWNSKRWVEQDLKRITELSYKNILVTNDSEKAFSEIRELIERMNMVTENNEDKLKKWIRDSIELDLVYDEENYNKVNGWDLPSVKDAYKSIEDHKSADLFNSLDNSKSSDSYYFYFKCLKKRRIFYDLEYDKARKAFADQDPNFEYKSVCEADEVRKEILDGIMWRCAAAISDLLTQKKSLKKNEVPTFEETYQIKEFATLIALFHSELCASATPDVSLGQANTFHLTVPEEAIGYEVFKWLARHNLARGYTHIHLNLEALKYIDTLVDDFPNKISGFAKSINCDENLLYQWLFFPTSRTLAQSLLDLGRHSEQRYYLKKALDVAKSKNIDHWKNRLQLDLDLEWRDSEISLNSDEISKRLDNWKNLPARLEEACQTVKSSCPELFLNKTDDEKKWNEWKESEEWIIRWHSADLTGFGRHLKTIAKTISEMLKNRPGKKLSIKALQSMIKMLVEVYSGIKRFGQNGKKPYPYVYYLIPDNDGDNFSEKDRVSIWEQGSALFSAIRDILDDEDISEREEIEKRKGIVSELSSLKWKEHLKKLLNKKDIDFDKYRSQAIKADVFREDQWPQQYKCPRDKVKVTCKSTCPANTFSGDVSPIMKDTHLAQLGHYKSIMAGQQERFLNYLKYRTGQKRCYRQGEAYLQTPNFELICLRRWNSFSPNLGSRAAATVGGGYLVRAWDEDKKRYIGIVIDPGYNFLENLFNEGFTLPDIDVVVITHAHPDHIENLTNILTLIRERKNRVREKNNEENGDHCRISPQDHRILLAMTEGVFERFSRYLDDEKDYIRDVLVLSAANAPRGNKAGKNELKLLLDSNNDVTCHMKLECNKENKGKISLRAARAWHFDGTDHDSMGVVIEYNVPSKDPYKLGIIGDTRYIRDDLCDDYKDCDVVVAHLGSLIDKKMYMDMLGSNDKHNSVDNNEFNDKLLKLITKKNHLYLPGLALLICNLQIKSRKFPLFVLSEFGEELRGGLRRDLTLRLSSILAHPDKTDKTSPIPIIPGDVGLRIDIENNKVFCCICNRYEDPINIKFETVLPDEESMAYVCNDCYELRRGELTKLLEQWCTTARPVCKLEKKAK
ncbi:MAG: MBL fold metallo-hydrolase [Desulfobacterales bacterium]|nr:MBL fold metallo-hydrolase [Desulfobacterales bacterium]